MESRIGKSELRKIAGLVLVVCTGFVLCGAFEPVFELDSYRRHAAPIDNLGRLMLGITLIAVAGQVRRID